MRARRSLTGLYYAMPVLLLAVVAALVATVRWLDQPPPDRDVPMRLQEVADAAAAGQWPEIRQAARRLEADWQVVRKRLRFSVGHSYLEHFDVEVAALSGAAEGQDLAQVMIIQQRLSALWEDMGL